MFIPRLGATGIPVIPRVKSPDTECIEADLKTVVGCEIFGNSVVKRARALLAPARCARTER